MDSLLEGLDHASHRVEAGAAIGERTDAGEHDALRGKHLRGVAGDDDRHIKPRLARRPLERLVGRVQVARAVIDNRDGHRAPRSASGNRPMTGCTDDCGAG